MKSLTNEELSYLVGGNTGELSDSIAPDITNTNGTATCVCTYKNASVITNENSASGCRCVCERR